MGKKKPFIDKKNASTYHLVRRSQQDVGGYFDEETGEALDVPREFVLMPSVETQEKIEKQKNTRFGVPGNIPEETFDMDPRDALTRAKMQLEAANLVDEYDYERHMMPITGDGVFFGASGERCDPANDVRAQKVPIQTVIKEIDRHLDSIAITTDCMDDDIARALNDYNEDDYEEILDDFCITAAEEPDIEDNTGYAFDFDAHVERLIEKAKLEENGGPKVVPSNHTAWYSQQQSFQGLQPFHKNENDFENGDVDLIGGKGIDGMNEYIDPTPGVVAKLNRDEERALCEKFEQTLLEYDSDDLGDLDDECYEIRGDKPLEGDVHIEAALDHFIQDRKDENFIIGTRHKEVKRGGGSKAFVNNKLLPFNTIDQDEVEKGEELIGAEDVLAEADMILANPEIDLPPEEVLIDGMSYFTMKERNPWDCESILSTYSNMDNNPAVISRKHRRRKKGRNKGSQGLELDEQAIPEEQPVQILLSNKTGLPLGVLPDRQGGNDEDSLFEEESYLSVNKGEARKKSESKDEKRLRKQAVKEDRRIARIQKKMMREAIEEEFSKRSAKVEGNDVAGKSVFRYS